VFIRQTIRSDYCAVHSTAMALTLAGHPTSRLEGLRLFEAGRRWTGASHASISRAILRRTGRLGRWRHGPSGNELELLPWLQRMAAALKGSPAVVTAYCQHRTLDLICGHSFVLVGLTPTHVELLDPLGKRPAAGQSTNVLLSLAQQPNDGLLATTGAVWDLRVDQKISVLKIGKSADGAPPLSARCTST